MYSRPAGLGRRRRNRPRDGGVREPVKEKVFQKIFPRSARQVLKMSSEHDYTLKNFFRAPRGKISKYFLKKAISSKKKFFPYISLSLAQLGSTNPCSFRGGGDRPDANSLQLGFIWLTGSNIIIRGTFIFDVIVPGQYQLKRTSEYVYVVTITT